MTPLLAIVLYILFVVATVGIYMAWPAHGGHERPRGLDLDVYPATPVAETAPAAPWQPRAVPDVPMPAEAACAPFSATATRILAHLDAMIELSWADHDVLQRNNDIQVFSTVLNSLCRHGMTYA
jgi:hypothetical protein